MSKFYNFSLFVLLVISFMPTTVFAQASTIVSEREPIVVYSENDLNPKQPGYEWTGSTLLQDIRVIDGMGNEPQTGQDVLIADGKIQAVGKTGALDIPKDARIIDGGGLTVMPGLIDAHIHVQGGWRGGNDNGPRPLTLKWDLLALLYSGVTHAFDAGNIPERAADARDILAAGGWMGPELTIAGTYFETAPVGAVGSNTILPVPDAGYIGGHLDTMKNVYGVEMVKCHSGTNSQVLRVLVSEAHKRDMRVICDLWHNNMNPWIARQTHLDGFAHNAFAVNEITPESAQMLADEGTFVIATSVVMDAFAQARVKQEGAGYIGDNPLIIDVQPPHYVEAHNNGGLEGTMSRYATITKGITGDIMTPDEMRGITIRSTKTLIDNGVLVGLGTDSAYPTVWFGEAMHREMEIWVNESGISPLITLQAATYHNARILKIEDRTGSIQTGLEGDLLVVEGNPAKNISDTRNIRYVIKNGKLVDRESLTRQWRF
ncbi:amidohydrolase family protein [Gammaproteobacteria bacterium]|nr:amidohydrolase family protein [Gammaproteobacteria bacterium]